MDLDERRCDDENVLWQNNGINNWWIIVGYCSLVKLAWKNRKKWKNKSLETRIDTTFIKRILRNGKIFRTITCSLNQNKANGFRIITNHNLKRIGKTIIVGIIDY